MKLNYIEKGSGPPVVLVHGWGGSIKSLEKLGDLMAGAGYKVVMIDLPGFGASPAPETALSMDNYVELIASMVHELDLHKPVYIGHSFGGKIGMFLAVKYPLLLSKLILIDASGIRPIKTFKQKVTHILAKIGKIIFWIPPLFLLQPLAKFFYYRFVVKEMDYYKSGKLRETFKIIIDEHIDDKLQAIKTDTLIIWGSKDTYTPLWNGEKIAKYVKNSRLEIIQDVGHGLPLVYPQIVSELIINFLN